MGVDIEKLFAKAHQLQRSGQLPQAISCYEQLLNCSPNHVKALHFLGLAHAQMDDMKSAITYLCRALKQQPTDARLHNNLANAYKHSHAYDQAIYHYQQAIQLDPHYAQAHNNLAAVYALQGEFKPALHHYRLAINTEPDFAVAHYNLGLLLLKNNQLEAAQKQFNNVLAIVPHHVDAQFYIGVLQLEANALEKAERAFHNVLLIDSEHVQALTNLGVIALKHEKGQLAIDYFTKALALDNHNVDARNNLAATFIHNDRFENALMHYDVLLQHDPHNIEYLYNTGVAQMALGHLQEAIMHFKTILTLQDQHFATLNNLAAIHLRLGKRVEAIAFLNRAIVANPKDEASQFMLNALTGREKNPHSCSTYVMNLYNHYALYYENHLQGPLGYSLPHRIGRILHQLDCNKVKNTIDLGCGTGLCGVVLREVSEHLTGVDMAAKMLAEANHKGIYDELIEAELIAFLQNNTQRYELAVAADVLPYLGELDTLFAAIHQRLAKEGLFIFTHEISTSEAWKLQDSARFSHHPDYIKTLCKQHDFQIVYQEKVVARQQQEKPLYVMLYAIQARHKTV